MSEAMVLRLWNALLDTVAMVGVSALIALLAGIPLAVFLVLSAPGGLVEAAEAMGCRRRHIVRHVLLPEALPSLVGGFTITVVTMIGASAMAGAVGAGGSATSPSATATSVSTRPSCWP